VRAPWFRCDPSKLLGAIAGMPPDCGYVYTVIIMRIYETGGPVADDAGVISRRTGMPLKRVELALEWLLTRVKLALTPDHCFDCEKTHSELAGRKKRISDAKTAGKHSAEKRLINQSPEPTVVEPSFNYKDIDIIRDTNVSLVNAEVVDLSEASKSRKTETLRVFGETWNALAAELGLPAIETIKPGSTRERHALARARELVADYPDLTAGLKVLTAKIRGSPLLRGEVGNRQWRASFDWVVNAANFTKIMEGVYEVRQTSG
jgi:hypothetical protein